MSKRTIPVVDLSKFVNGNEKEKAAFVEEIGTAFHEIGFVGVTNHGIPKELIEGFYTNANQFFQPPCRHQAEIRNCRHGRSTGIYLVW